MVERYSHLSPDHLRTAVEKLVAPRSAAETAMQVARSEPDPTPELDSNLTRGEARRHVTPVSAVTHRVTW